MKKIYFLLTALMLVACGGRSADNASTLRLGAMSSMDYIPYVVAEELGIYDSLGVQVEIVKFFSANDRDAALQSGNIDATVIDFTGAVMQHAKGTDLCLLTKNDGLFHLVAGKKSAADSVAALRGKAVAVSRNTVIEFVTDAALADAGVAPEAVEKPEINKIPIRLEMLRSGAIDATLLPDPFASMAVADGCKILTDNASLGISVTGTVARGEAVRSKAEAIVKLLQGYDAAVQYINNSPLEQWSSVLVRDAGVPPQLVDSVRIPRYEPSRIPTAEELASTVRWLKEKRLIPADYHCSELIKCRW